jgi:hypothetical protein
MHLNSDPRSCVPASIAQKQQCSQIGWCLTGSAERGATTGKGDPVSLGDELFCDLIYIIHGLHPAGRTYCCSALGYFTFFSPRSMLSVLSAALAAYVACCTPPEKVDKGLTKQQQGRVMGWHHQARSSMALRQALRQALRPS